MPDNTNNDFHINIVLLGDSIFDNATYVPDGPDVINHLQGIIPLGWKATLIAHDGDVTSDVEGQLSSLPDDATHLVISIGGNDGLHALSVFSLPAGTVNDALTTLTEVRQNFQRAYRAMLWQALGYRLPLAVCTIYDAVPGLSPETKTALSIFNDTITREAFGAGVPIIDLRHVCSEAADYSAISPIEPSVQGGKKIARAIADWLMGYLPSDLSGHSECQGGFDGSPRSDPPITNQPDKSEMTLPNVPNYAKRFEATLFAPCEGDYIDEQTLSIIEIDENSVRHIDCDLPGTTCIFMGKLTGGSGGFGERGVRLGQLPRIIRFPCISTKGRCIAGLSFEGRIRLIE